MTDVGRLGSLVVLILVGGLLVLAGGRATAADGQLPVEPIHEEILHLGGDRLRPVTLEVTLFTPDGPGPFPLAVMNHGANFASNDSRGERYRFTVAAYYFLSRGYAVALPMMRGFAGSDGAILHMGCNLFALAYSNGRDIRAVIDAIASRPDIDRSQIVVAGQGYGGWNTLGLGAAAPQGIRGLIAFNAAIRSSDCRSQDASLNQTAGELGAKVPLPSLWFYGDNDSVLPMTTWREMYGRYAAANQKAELVAFGRFKGDSHQFLSDPASLPFWSGRVDAFLARIGLPSAIRYPGYLPHPSPPPTHWARLEDATAVPFINDQGRDAYRSFLRRPAPRAFAIAPSGAVVAGDGGYDPVGRVLANCQKVGPECRLYAVDTNVVWVGANAPGARAGTPGVEVRVVNRTIPANVSSPLGSFYAINPDCSLRGLPKVTVTQAPTHGALMVGAAETTPNFPPASSYAACNTHKVPSTGIRYTPAAGYSGTDTIQFDETNPDGSRQSIRIVLKVM